MNNTVIPPMPNPAGFAVLIDNGGDYVTVAASGLTGVEVVHVYYGVDYGYVESGFKLTAEMPVIRLNGAGVWRIVKDGTAQPVGIYVSNSTKVRMFGAYSTREHGLDFDAGYA